MVIYWRPHLREYGDQCYQGFIGRYHLYLFCLLDPGKTNPFNICYYFFSSLLIGVVGYLFIPYSMNIWFQTPGAMTNFADALICWGLCGLWLGW